MADIFIEGFDKYGPPGMIGTAGGTGMSLSALLTQGEWTSWTEANSATVAIVSGLTAVSGNAIQFPSGTTGTTYLSKTLGANYSRLIGGTRIQFSVGSATGGIQFLDGSTVQCSIIFNPTGTFTVYKGTYSGTVLTTSTASVSLGSIHYLEWDITFGASAAYHIYLDGVSIISGTGQTETSGNSYASVFQIGAFTALGAGSYINFDDLYLFSSTGSTNNAMLNTNPVVQTQFPNSDSSVAFTFGANVLGIAYYMSTSTNAPGANELFLRPFTPAASCTLNSVACLPQATSVGANFKAVLYADSAGAPGSLTATGAQATGTTAGTTLTSAFGSGQSLTGGTQYWIGFITDTSVVLQESDTSTTGRKIANTYTAGAPGTAGSMTTGLPNWLIFGNITGLSTNYTEEAQSPPLGVLSYVYSDTVSQSDLYGFPALSGTPGTIYTVCVKGYESLSTSGTRTVNLQLKSGSTTSVGSNSGQSPPTSWSWCDSFYDVDPNTGVAWTVSGLNAATCGVEVAS